MDVMLGVKGKLTNKGGRILLLWSVWAAILFWS